MRRTSYMDVVREWAVPGLIFMFVFLLIGFFITLEVKFGEGDAGEASTDAHKYTAYAYATYPVMREPIQEALADGFMSYGEYKALEVIFEENEFEMDYPKRQLLIDVIVLDTGEPCCEQVETTEDDETE